MKHEINKLLNSSQSRFAIKQKAHLSQTLICRRQTARRSISFGNVDSLCI